jgi:hypothetical protein
VPRYPRQQFQTITDNKKGNCFSACLAMLLGVEVNDVPPFVKEYGDWWDVPCALWLRHHFGMTLLQINCRDQQGQGTKYLGHFQLNSGVQHQPYMIAGGRSPRGDWGHAVVGYITSCFEWHTVFDPHPSGLGIVDNLVQSLYLPIPINPVEFADLKSGYRHEPDIDDTP